MEEYTKKLLLDIDEAIEHIGEFTGSISSLSEYENNLMVRRAVERELEIIGEAMNRLVNAQETIEITHARRIVDLRNRVIHGYDKVDNALIWGILQRHLPLLKEEIDFLRDAQQD